MHQCLLTESLPQCSLIDSDHQVGPNVELTSSWAGEVPIGISLKLVAYWQGRAMHCQIAGQDLLLNIRMWRNTAEQWLPANGYAHAALLHKDTLGPVCFSFLTVSFTTSDFDFTGLFNFCTSFFSLYSEACQSAVLIYIPLQQLPHDYMCRIYYS